MVGSVLIAGAGIGGLTLALALARGGIKVDIFERAEVLSEVGAGLQQSANAMQVHVALGIADAVIARGFEPNRATMRRHDSGKMLLNVALKGAHRARYGQPYIHIHRADLHDILATAAVQAGATIHLGHAVSGYSQANDSVTVHSNKGERQGDILIGADGIHSSVRQSFPPHLREGADARFTGQIAWRGTVPTDALPENLVPRDATIWLGPGRHLVAYYLRGGSLVNFVAVEERDEWTADGWHQAGDKADLLAAFADFETTVTTLLKACDAPFLWGLFDRPPLPHWTDGRVGLLGDACHPMLPFMAQGAAMAVEDAYVLSEAILNTGDAAYALRSYEATRKPRTTKMQEISRNNADSFHHRQAAPRFLRDNSYRLASALPILSHMKLRGIYGHDVTKD